jgi:hypothetical protein
MNAQTCATLIPFHDYGYAIADEKALMAARQGVLAIAERNAVLRLVAVAELIEASMSRIDQPAMYARLRGALADLRSFGLEAHA